MRRAIATLLLAAALAVPAGAAVVHDLELFIGEATELEVGLVERVLNLDPEIVRCVATAPDRLLVEGLAWGEATVRVWTVDGRQLVLKLRVPGIGPSTPAQALPIDEGGLGLRSSLHLFSYDTAGVNQLVPAAAFEAAGNLAGLRGEAELWLEERDGEIEAPRYRLQVHKREGGVVDWSLLAGNSRSRWSRFTLMDQHLEGVQLQAGATVAGRPLGLQLAWGRQGQDRQPLGSRHRSTLDPDTRLGGGRLTIGLSETVQMIAEVGARWEHNQDAEANAVLAVAHDGPGLQVSAEVASDGERWSGGFSGRFGSASTSLSLRGEAVADGFNSLRSGSGLNGNRSLSTSFDHRGERWSVGLSGSWRDLDPGAFMIAGAQEIWTRSTQAGGRAAARLGRSSSIEAHLQWREQGLGEHLWNHDQAWLVLRSSSPSSGRSLRFEVEGALGAQEYELTGPITDDWRWTAARLDLGLTAGSWLRANAAVTRRFSFAGSGEAPEELLWSAGLTASAGSIGPLAEAELRARLHSWDHLVATTGHFESGQHLSVQGALRTHWWRRMAVEGRTSWSRDLERDSDSIAAEICLRLDIGRHRRRHNTEKQSPKTTVRGVVFADHNSNGLRDPEDEGIEGVAVRLGDGEQALSNRKGEFRFRRVPRDQAEVRLVQASIPEGLELTGAPMQTGSRLDFGLGPAPAVVALSTFNDLDGDGARDADEPLVDGVRADLGSRAGTVTSSEDGPALLKVPAGATLQLRWHITTLPEGYRPAPGAPLQVELHAVAGVSVEESLPLLASRSVRGVVFFDRNGNGTRDRGEEMAAGVVLSAGNRIALSGDNGAFTLKALPAGSVVVQVRARGLPDGWQAPPATELSLAPGPGTLGGTQIGLRPIP